MFYLTIYMIEITKPKIFNTNIRNRNLAEIQRDNEPLRPLKQNKLSEFIDNE